MADISFFIGAVLGIVVTTAIASAAVWRWNRDVPGILVANGLSLFFATVIAGFGMADGRDPVFGEAFATYVFPQCLVLVVMLWRWNKRRRLAEESGDAAAPATAEKPSSRRTLGILSVVLAVLGGLVAIVLAGGVGREVGREAARAVVDREPTAEELVVASVEYVRQQIPQLVDDDTTLVDVRADGRMLVYVH